MDPRLARISFDYRKGRLLTLLSEFLVHMSQLVDPSRCRGGSKSRAGGLHVEVTGGGSVGGRHFAHIVGLGCFFTLLLS
jgi:hypothetical protein